MFAFLFPFLFVFIVNSKPCHSKFGWRTAMAAPPWELHKCRVSGHTPISWEPVFNRIPGGFKCRVRLEKHYFIDCGGEYIRPGEPTDTLFQLTAAQGPIITRASDLFSEAKNPTFLFEIKFWMMAQLFLTQGQTTW